MPDGNAHAPGATGGEQYTSTKRKRVNDASVTSTKREQIVHLLARRACRRSHSILSHARLFRDGGLFRLLATVRALPKLVTRLLFDITRSVVATCNLLDPTELT